MTAVGSRTKPEVLLLAETAEVGLPDGWYFTGLAGILLLTLQRPVKGWGSRYFENK